MGRGSRLDLSAPLRSRGRSRARAGRTIPAALAYAAAAVLRVALFDLSMALLWVLVIVVLSSLK
jgi:hypothetical protein